MEENKLIVANMVHATAGVQVQVYTTVKVQHGGQPAAWEKVTSNDVFVQQTKYDRKQKASKKAKQQCKKANFTNVDNDVNARRTYSRHSGNDVDICANLPACNL